MRHFHLRIEQTRRGVEYSTHAKARSLTGPNRIYDRRALEPR